MEQTYATREIVNWTSDYKQSNTTSVTLNTGETLYGSSKFEEIVKDINENGELVLEPSDGYAAIAKATLTVDVNSKLYAWSRTSDEDVTYYVYTLTETPTTSDKAYYANPDSGTDKIFQILNSTISLVISESAITVEGQVYTRATAADISL